MGGNLEDRSFRMKHGLDHIRQTISARNASYETWGWKHPQPHAYLEQVIPGLRNPRVIMVTRDLTANAAGLLAREMNDAAKAIRQSMLHTRNNIQFVRKHRLPTLMVSYEKLLVSSEEVIQEIAHFCDIDVDQGKIAEAAEFVRPGGYQASEATRTPKE